jgi:hypothetical protein
MCWSYRCGTTVIVLKLQGYPLDRESRCPCSVSCSGFIAESCMILLTSINCLYHETIVQPGPPEVSFCVIVPLFARVMMPPS